MRCTTSTPARSSAQPLTSRRGSNAPSPSGRLPEAAARTARPCLRPCPELADALSVVDLVVEAAPERLEVKLDVFRALDALAPAHAVLATNTSALSPTRLATVTSRPGLVLGMHFFNPVSRMRLVELVRADQTVDEAVELARAVSHRMGKTVVVVDDVPGFVTTRLSALAGNEAFFMLMERVASAEEIDEAVRSGANHPMGPLELADLVGLDVRLHILEHLHRTFGEKFRPCPLLVRYVNAGRLGRKTGHGVYRYGPDGARLPQGTVTP